MTEPSKERIAAALALAEAVIAYDAKATQETAEEHQAAVRAYRATAPRLRTRAEVDAELADWIRSAVESKLHINPTWSRVLELCSEPLAPEPAEPSRLTDHDADQRPPPYGPSSVDRPDSSPSSVPAAGATSTDACSCDESERLHGYMKDIKFLHRQWSDENALAGSVLTQIGGVVLRWMSNLP